MEKTNNNFLTFLHLSHHHQRMSALVGFFKCVFQKLWVNLILKSLKCQQQVLPCALAFSRAAWVVMVKWVSAVCQATPWNCAQVAGLVAATQAKAVCQPALWAHWSPSSMFLVQYTWYERLTEHRQWPSLAGCYALWKVRHPPEPRTGHCTDLTKPQAPS